jgi:hypothetical protein
MEITEKTQVHIRVLLADQILNVIKISSKGGIPHGVTEEEG